ncbi:LysR family transcriptional regulator [Rhodobacterales bacterium]|nr:LysR family transcriptional regulator [Rhodobacterales bacterium]
MDVMDWNAIKMFAAVCETGSLVRAAERIGVSHATVFRHIAALERQVGTRLFDRVKGRYVLTDAGADLKEIGAGIITSFEEIDRRVAGRDEVATGTVRLTAPRSFSDSVLPGYLAEFARDDPGIAVELLVSNQELNMSDRSADVALRVAQHPPDHLWGRRILNIDWAVYASPDYLQERGPVCALEDLRAHKLLAPAGTLARHPAFRTILSEAQPLSLVSCDDLTTMASLAAGGHGIALLPDDMRRPDLVRICPYPAAPANCLWILTHPDLKGLRRVSLLMGYLARAFRRDPVWNP